MNHVFCFGEQKKKRKKKKVEQTILRIKRKQSMHVHSNGEQTDKFS